MSTSLYAVDCAAVNRETPMLEDRPFWRKDPPVIEVHPETGKKKLVKGGMFGTQLAFWNMQNRVKVIVGGFGSGKTLTLCKRMIALALENAPCPVATVSPTHVMALKTVIPTIEALLQGKRSIYGRQFFYRRVKSPIQLFEIRFRGRSGLIWCLSSDNPLSLRGPNLAAVGIDEPFIQPQSVFEEMRARIRHPDARHEEMILSGTPEQLNWGYKLCTGAYGDENDVGVVTMSTRENTALRDSYVADLEATLSAKAVAAYVDGQFLNMTEGQVYYAFDPMEHVVDLELPSSAELGCGMDFNVNPMSAVVFWRAGSHMHIIDELELPNTDTLGMAVELRERWPKLKKIYPDATGSARKTSASGETDFSILRKYGFTIHAPAGNPPVRVREMTVNGKMRPANDRLTFTLSPKCTSLREYLTVYSHELRNKAEQKRMSHLIDALGYPICRLFPLARSGVRQVGF